MEKRKKIVNDVRCCECGQFCKPVDSGTLFGTWASLEPPPSKDFCYKCYNKKLKIAINMPEQIVISCWWIKPNYVRIAKSILRHKREKGKVKK